MDSSAPKTQQRSWRQRSNGAKPAAAGQNQQSQGQGQAPHKRTPSDGSQPDPKKRHRGGRRKASAGSARDGEVKKIKADTSSSMDVDTDVVEPSTSVPTTMAHLSDVTFASLDISDKTKRAIVEDLKYERLTHVQSETFAHISEGKDILAKAKTGNGKTIAFLLPTIENLLRVGRQRNTIPVLVISPTRELALQIATEARRVSVHHHLNIACFVGGNSIGRDVKTLSADSGIDILVATPGRLQDHLGQDTAKIGQKLSKCRVLVLDEADRLLDMGFRPEIMRIISRLPANRQTLLFSATLPESTEELKNVALRADYEFVDTIGEDEHQTNVQTVQEYVTCSMDDVAATVETILAEHMQRPEYKVMAFFPTARAAAYMAQLFVEAGFNGILEMHSRKSQSARTKTADAFRKGKKVIMFSSDVSARGVDYPDVSLVLQVGLTDRDQYIHRLGRTARAGMEGRGMLVLADFETPLLKELSDLPLSESKSLEVDRANSRTGRTISRLKSGSELEKSAQQSYQAWLGFYNTHLKRLKLDKPRLVQLAEHYSKTVGLSEVPLLEKKTLKKMNLFGVAGITPSPYEQRNGGGGGNGGGYGGNRGGNGGGRGGGGGWRR